MFHSNMSAHCDVVETTARVRHENIRRVIAKGLDSAWSLPEFGANDNSAGGSSSGTDDDGGISRSAGAYSS